MSAAEKLVKAIQSAIAEFRATTGCEVRLIDIKRVGEAEREDTSAAHVKLIIEVPK